MIKRRNLSPLRKVSLRDKITLFLFRQKQARSVSLSMFKKTLPPQIDMFRALGAHLSDRKTSILDDPTSWHNVFFREVTRRVDESVFEPLFNEGGRPNAPLRVLLAMMVLKEGNGWSDEQLFGSCRFDLRCMRALGLYGIDDDPRDNGEKKGMLERLGHIIRELLPHCGGDGVLARLYREQYQEVPDDGDPKGPEGPAEKVELKKVGDIPSDSMQSVHDPEAAFRRKGHGKGEKQVSGYHANLTETFGEENPFELLTDVRTEVANICEDAFLLPAIEGSDGVLDTGGEGRKTVVHVTTDGGYDSRANREAMADTDALHWNMALHKGAKQRYE